MSGRRDPALMTFQEVFSEFGKGTLSSSSPASRRTGYMSFAKSRPVVSAPATRRSSATRGISGFRQFHCTLIRNHFATLLSELHEEGVLRSSEYGQLTDSMRRAGWEKDTLPNWMRKYTEYIVSFNQATFGQAATFRQETFRFVNSLLSDD